MVWHTWSVSYIYYKWNYKWIHNNANWMEYTMKHSLSFLNEYLLAGISNHKKKENNCFIEYYLNPINTLIWGAINKRVHWMWGHYRTFYHSHVSKFSNSYIWMNPPKQQLVIGEVAGLTKGASPFIWHGPNAADTFIFFCVVTWSECDWSLPILCINCDAVVSPRRVFKQSILNQRVNTADRNMS